jgi:uncharacterized surface protein with fasciclin (FAS1) repeats
VTTSKKGSDKPKVAFTLDQIEQEAHPDIEPLRMGVNGKVIELRSPMDMEASALVDLLEAMEQNAQMSELGEAAQAIKMLPVLLGEENYQILLDAKASFPALMKISEKVEAYYEEAFAAAGVDDPKGSSSQ